MLGNNYKTEVASSQDVFCASTTDVLRQYSINGILESDYLRPCSRPRSRYSFPKTTNASRRDAEKK
jgi:hypothetical protein